MHRIEDIDLAVLNAFLQQEGLTRQVDWRPAHIDGPVVAARSGDQIVGAARTSRRWLHPQRWRLAIHVAPDWRRQGIGTDLLDAIIARIPGQDRELQASIFSGNDAANALLRHAGFELLMTTRLGTLHVAEIPIAWRERCHRARHSLERQGLHVDTLQAKPDLFQQTALFHERIYRDQHAWNPPRALTAADCDELFMDQIEFEPAMQFLVLNGEALCAVASLRYTQARHHLDFGWIGLVDVPPKYRMAVYRALLGTCLDAAIRRNASISLEIDRVDPHLNAIIDELPVAWDDTWLMYRRIEH